jgi:hypothetical protein
LQDSKPRAEASAAIQAESAPGITEIIKALLFYVKPKTNLLFFSAAGPAFLGTFYLGAKIYSQGNQVVAIRPYPGEFSPHTWTVADDLRLCLGRSCAF